MFAVRRVLQLKRSEDAKIANQQSRGHALLHAFSPGGCNTAIQLALSLREEYGVSLGPSLKLLVLDSCPGDTSFQHAHEAAILSLPLSMQTGSSFVQYLGRTFLCPAVSFLTFLQRIGVLMSVSDLRASLNDQGTFGNSSKEAISVL
ncbi:hypothetical protein VTO42DRAFT_1995 [Malbranchea cinnamomea]